MIKNGMASMEKDCVEFITFCRISQASLVLSTKKKK